MSLSHEQQKLAAEFPEVTWAMSEQLCIFRPDGALTNSLVGRMLAWLAKVETDRETPFNRFTDLTRVHTHELNQLDVSNVAYWRRATYTGPQVKSAFLARSAEALELAKAYRSHMAGSTILVLVFESLQEAADWLRVPAKALAGAE